MVYEDILIEPVLSEKATALRDENKYVFKVNLAANKTQIKEAVRKLFNVKVADCTVMNVGGKNKRVRYRAGKTSNWKKAIVKLTPDSKTIEFFDSLM